MAAAAHFDHRDSQSRNRRDRRHNGDAHPQRRRLVVLVSVAVLCALLVPALLIAHAALSQLRANATDSRSTVPADLFIQSVTQDDGALGWHQLCPDLQAQLPENMLVQQANAQHAQMAEYGVTLTATLIGSRPQAAGGQMRQYVLTAHWPDRTTQQKTYTVFTEASGCVADISIQ